MSIPDYPVPGPDRQGQGTMGDTVEAGSERIRDHLRRSNPNPMKTTDQIRSTVFLTDPHAEKNLS